MVKIIKNITLLILCCGIYWACSKEEPEMPTNNENNQENTVSNNNNSNNSSSTSEDQYYFKFTSLASREIKPEAGSTQIYFECNQEYVVTTSGNITGLKVSPTSGKGNGSVTASFGEVEYKESGSNITWNESGYVVFTVKEGTKSNFKTIKKEFYLVRKGSKMKV